MSNPVSIVLVDDHQILLDGIHVLLELNENYKIVDSYNSGEELLEQAGKLEADLLIIDINMKGMDGIQTLKELRINGFEGYCIFLSSYDDLKLVNEAIKTGGQGYVTKSSATKYLEEAIDIVLRGGNYYSPDIKERIVTSFSFTGESDYCQNEHGLVRQLTEREREVLTLIGQEFTSSEIAAKLYIAKSTVDSHRKHLIAKLKVKNAVGLGLFAERNGLI